ncbi:MAG: nucleotide sugar dehydrogenase [Anaerolineaceae bacterium]|nr:MAG: nucleotide sugar dehydrogenase [Anaerolineaceae bacterium]
MDNENIKSNDSLVQHLKNAIRDKTAKVCVIGLGYVGLPLAVEKAKVGFKVLGIDQNTSRVSMLNSGLNYIQDVKDEELRILVEKKTLAAVNDFSVLLGQDIIIICVPTPLNEYHEPDLSYVESVTKEISKNLRKGQMIILESTTYPGTTQEVILPLLESTGLKAGEDFFLANSPERVDPGNKRYTTKNTTKVVGGVTHKCLEVAQLFYAQTILNVVPVSSPTVAEMTKVFENTYRAVNIALVNELMMLCNKMGISVWEVVEAAATKPFGIQTFYPGPGVGGHCIPIDPFYLSWKARQYDYSTRFIDLAGEINIQVSNYVVDKVVKALNMSRKPVNGSKVFVLGIAYKRDINDYRESPALKIMKKLKSEGAELVFYDPYIKSMPSSDGVAIEADWVDLSEEELRKSDCVLIITDHSNIDYEMVVRESIIVVDSRNATKNVISGREKIILV